MMKDLYNVRTSLLYCKQYSLEYSCVQVIGDEKMKHKKGKLYMLTNIFLIMGLLCLIYFAMYVVFVDLTNIFTYFWLVAGVGLIVLRQVILYSMANHIRVPAAVKWILGIGFLLVFLVLAVTEGVIIGYGAAKPSEDADYVLVLGAQIKGTNPTYALVKRLNVAYEYLADNPDTLVILSGGKGPGEDVTEAYAMKEYLKKKGIEQSRMLLEEQSTNTYENIEYSKKLMESPEDSVVLVTNHFHVYRGVGVAKKQGLTNVEGLGAPTKWYTVPNLYLREAFAVIKYILCGQI